MKEQNAKKNINFPGARTLQSNKNVKNTFEGTIREYNVALSVSDDPLQKIRDDFRDANTPYYTQVFSQCRDRSKSTFFNLCLAVQSYYQVSKNNREKKIFETLISKLKQQWDNFKSTKHIGDINIILVQWLNLPINEHTLIQQRQLLQAAYLFTTYLKLSIKQSIVKSTLISPSMSNMLDELDAAITMGYKKIENTIIRLNETKEALIFDDTNSFTDQFSLTLKQVIAQKDFEIGSIKQTYLQCSQNLMQLDVLYKFLQINLDCDSQMFFEKYDDKSKLIPLLEAFGIPQSKHKNWMLSLNAHRASGVAHGLYNLNYYLSSFAGLVNGPVAVAVDIELLFDLIDESVIRIAGDLNVQLDEHIHITLNELIQIANSNQATQDIEQHRESAQKLLDEIADLPKISRIDFCKPTKKYQNFEGLLKLYSEFDKEDKTTSVHISKDYIKRHLEGTIIELDNYKYKTANQQAELNGWLARINQIKDQVDVTQDENITNHFNSYVNNVVALVIPSKLPQDVTSIEDKIKHLRAYHDGINNTIDTTISAFSKSLTDFEKNNNLKAINAIKNQIKLNSNQFWNKILMFVSPSYRNCVNHINTMIDAIEKIRDEDSVPIDTSNANLFSYLQHEVQRASVATKGWFGWPGRIGVGKLEKPVNFYTNHSLIELSKCVNEKDVCSQPSGSVAVP